MKSYFFVRTKETGLLQRGRMARECKFKHDDDDRMELLGNAWPKRRLGVTSRALEGKIFPA